MVDERGVDEEVVGVKKKREWGVRGRRWNGISDGECVWVKNELSGK